MRTPSVRSSAAMWIFVVAAAMPNARAISLLDHPGVVSAKTWRWRFVSLQMAVSIDGVGDASPPNVLLSGSVSDEGTLIRPDMMSLMAARISVPDWRFEMKP